LELAASCVVIPIIAGALANLAQLDANRLQLAPTVDSIIVLFKKLAQPADSNAGQTLKVDMLKLSLSLRLLFGR
jgi:hypothetical protein